MRWSAATFNQLSIFVLAAAVIDLLDLRLEILNNLLLLGLRLSREVHNVDFVWYHLSLEGIV